MNTLVSATLNPFRRQSCADPGLLASDLDYHVIRALDGDHLPVSSVTRSGFEYEAERLISVHQQRSH